MPNKTATLKLNAPVVSIIIPVYNAGAYLEETILSALAQTWANKEIIIVDDGSTDNSLAIAKKYESQSIKVFTQVNAGAGSSRNKGLKEASGNYIQFLDADDLLDKAKIELQVMALQNLDDAIAYCPFVNFADSQNLPTKRESYLTADYLNGTDFLFDLYGGKEIMPSTGAMIPIFCWLVSKSVITQAGNWNETLSVDDDGEFFCRILLHSKNIKYVADAKGFYRMHTHHQNLSSQSSFNGYLSTFNSLKLKKQHIDDNRFNVLFANQALQLMVNIYPGYRSLRRKIAGFIKQSGGNTWRPYRENPHKIFRTLFGWRFVKLLSYYKNK